MDQGEPSPTRRKAKFVPRAPPNRKPKPPASNIASATSPHSTEDNAHARALWHRLNENVAKREPKETKSSVQVAFGPAESSSPLIRTHGVSKDSGEKIGSASKDFSTEQSAFTRSSTVVEDKSDARMIYTAEDTTKAPAWEPKRGSEEPWDYENSYYPTTLPLRKPYSGDPETLDKEEFGEAAANKEYDESTIKSAEELGLLEKSEQPKMLLFQFPRGLPLAKQPVSKKGKETVGASRESTKKNPLEELPQGYMGKMQVYKSGAVKLKLGETLFDVSPGSTPKDPENAVVINTAEKHCCVLGEVPTRAVITADLDKIEL